MRNLLSANLARLWRNRVFQIEVIFTAVMSVYLCIANYSPVVQASDTPLHLEDLFFNYYQFMGFVLAACISLIVGTEYSDGTIRNKLVVGHTRGAIYFANLIAAACSSVVVVLLHGVLTMAVGTFLFGWFTQPAEYIIGSVACAGLLTLEYSALFVLIAMNCSSKPVTAVSALVLMLALTYGASYLGSALNEPEMIYGTRVVTENTVEYRDLTANPYYLEGTIRQVYQFLYDLLPVGQLLQMYQLDFSRLHLWPWLTVGFSGLLTAVGFGCFRKKDIK